jgi:hypothetical protein
LRIKEEETRLTIQEHDDGGDDDDDDDEGLIWFALSYDMHRHYGVKTEINADGV